ncbi:cytochrome c-type biogenesis protein CcmH [Azorhizobium sp. AG788]|uniref:cytochrome c-type biogenesis protein n=1 Tax=Azorhizobium sp. AG788 TaxID=2183897 RepID=UPI001060D25D|nr:cytochrome c-type biogenesis protein [Azorhizobium sp. AG788]TDT92656.1 cytochrome c-type biogenesis protein CcmH [Azorhizobium sp. AG788]
MTRVIRLLAALFLTFSVLPALAVQPDEVLPDPAMEARARELSKELRCMVCQNQSIDDSDAQLARDLRILVRERLKAGDSNSQVLDFLVARYGEFVLMRPVFSWRNALLWGTPGLVLVLGACAAFFALRRRPTSASEALTPEEEARVKALLAASEEPGTRPE